MKHLLIALAVLVVVALAVLMPRRLASPPPALGQVAPFHLVADDGRPFEPASVGKRAWLASFLYTNCPGPCPRVVERLKTLRKRIPAAKLAFVSFTVDPQTDTPAVLTEYKAKHGIAPSDDWTFVTGPPAEVLAVVQKGFLVGVEEQAPDAGDGRVTHSVRVALVDAAGRIRGFYSTDDDAQMEHLIKDVAALD